MIKENEKLQTRLSVMEKERDDYKKGAEVEANLGDEVRARIALMEKRAGVGSLLLLALKFRTEYGFEPERDADFMAHISKSILKGEK